MSRRAKGLRSVLFWIGAAVLVLGCAVLFRLAWPAAPEPFSPVPELAVSPEPAASGSVQAEAREAVARTPAAGATKVMDRPSGLEIRGRVVDAGTMQPVAEVRVAIDDAGWPQPPGTVDLSPPIVRDTVELAKLEATTDDQGRFTLHGAWAEWTSLRFAHQRYRAAHRTARAWPTTGSTDVGDVLLEPVRVQELWIVDEAGRPFGGTLAFFVDELLSASKGRLWDSHSARTIDLAQPAAEANEAGRLALPLSESVHDVLLLHPEAAPTRLGALGLLEAAASGRALCLERGPPASVRVTRRSDLLAEPFRVTIQLRELQVALVQHLAAGDAMYCGALSRLEGPRIRTVQVSSAVGRDAYTEVRHDFTGTPDLMVSLDACRAGLITVHWDGVAPLPETVTLGLLRHIGDSEYLSDVRRVQPGQGPARFAPGGGRYAVVAFSPTLGFWRSHAFDLGPQDVDVRAGRWAGPLHQTIVRVRDDAGLPIPECRLLIGCGGGNPAWPLPLKVLVDVSRQARDAHRPFRLQARTDRSGECTLSGLPEGRITFLAAAPGIGVARVETTDVPPVVTVVVHRAGSIRGSVHSGSLEDLYRARAYVTVADDDDVGGPTSGIDADGRFAIAGLAGGSYRVRLVVPAGASIGGSKRMHATRHWELARTAVEVMAGRESTVQLVVGAEACSPRLALRLGASTSGKVAITELLGPHGDAGWRYEIPIQRQDGMSILDLSEVRHFVRVDSALGTAWGIVPIGRSTSVLELGLEPPRRIEWQLGEPAPEGKHRLVPCTSDGRSWAGCAACPVQVEPGDVASADAIVSGHYLLQAEQGGKWSLQGRLRVRGKSMQYEAASRR